MKHGLGRLTGWLVRGSATLIRLKSTFVLPLLIGGLTLVALGNGGSLTPGVVVGISVQSLVTAGFVFWQTWAQDTNLAIASLAGAFVAEAPDESLDRMIGTLLGLGDEATASHSEPAGAIFDLLADKLPGSGFEFHRRVAEVLPVLAIFNPNRAYDLALELRTDYDTRWTADIRRRVIEGLYVPVRGHRPFAAALKTDQKLSLLTPYSRDTFFVALAIYECIWSPSLSRFAMPKSLKDDVMSKMEIYIRNVLNGEQREALGQLVLTWQAAKAKNYAQVSDLIDEGFAAEDRYMRVVAARAAVTLDYGNRDRKLEYIAVIAKDENKYVRRVAAREVSQRFLLDCLRFSNLRPVAEEILEALAEDDDDIIRVTIMDMLEFGYRGTRSFRDALLDRLDEMDSAHILNDRIVRARARKCLS